MAISTGVGIGDETSYFDLQAGYAATKNIAVIANYMHCKGGSNDVPNGKYANGSNYELGIGYYKKFENVFIFQTFIGAGKTFSVIIF